MRPPSVLDCKYTAKFVEHTFSRSTSNWHNFGSKMKNLNQKIFNQFFVAHHTTLLLNLAREQESLATTAIYLLFSMILSNFHHFSQVATFGLQQQNLLSLVVCGKY